jgi:hypothetical protein
MMGALGAQRAQSDDVAVTPVVNFRAIGAERILQISLAVKDAEKTGRHLSDIFGCAWKFFEFSPRRITLNDRPYMEDCVLKLPIGQCGGYSLKLVQPISGLSSYLEFLQARGEGFYSIGVGAVPTGQTPLVELLARAGVGTEMQGDIGNGARFAVLKTSNELGCRIELTTLPEGPRSEYFRQTGVFLPQRNSVLEMDNPAIAGGRRFDEIGLIVGDEVGTAHRFAALLGVRDWFPNVHVRPTSENVFGKPVSEADIATTEVGVITTYFGDTLLEAIAPRLLKPGGSHRRFLDRCGPGIQFLRINSAGDDDVEIESLVRAGLIKEREATFYPAGKRSGPHAVSTFLSLPGELGGFVMQFFSLKSS